MSCPLSHTHRERRGVGYRAGRPTDPRSRRLHGASVASTIQPPTWERWPLDSSEAPRVRGPRPSQAGHRCSGPTILPTPLLARRRSCPGRQAPPCTWSGRCASVQRTRRGKALIIERSAPHCTVCKLSEGLTRQRPPSAEGRLIHAGHRPAIASDSGQLGGALDLRGPGVFGGVENNPRPAPVALVPVDGVGRWTLHVVRRSSLEDPRRRGRYVRRPRGAGRQPRAPRRR